MFYSCCAFTPGTAVDFHAQPSLLRELRGLPWPTEARLVGPATPKWEPKVAHFVLGKMQLQDLKTVVGVLKR